MKTAQNRRKDADKLESEGVREENEKELKERIEERRKEHFYKLKQEGVERELTDEEEKIRTKIKELEKEAKKRYNVEQVLNDNNLMMLQDDKDKKINI
jgi:hypothetical protein